MNFSNRVSDSKHSDVLYISLQILFYVSFFFREQTPKIGDVMKKFAPFLKLYTEYVQNFDNANVVISSWLEKSPKFASLVEKIQVCLIYQPFKLI